MMEQQIHDLADQAVRAAIVSDINNFNKNFEQAVDLAIVDKIRSMTTATLQNCGFKSTGSDGEFSENSEE